MSFIIKLVIVLLIFSFIVYVFKAIARFSFHLRRVKSEIKQVRDQVSGRQEVSAEMVRCARCGTFVATRDAVQLRIRDRSATFCSEICMQKDGGRG